MAEYVIFVLDDSDKNNNLLSRPTHTIYINLGQKKQGGKSEKAKRTNHSLMR